MMKSVLGIFCFFFFVLSQVFCQTSFNKEKLDSFFRALEDNNKFMGSVALSKNGVLVYANAVGFADVENKVETNTDFKYRVGSISKSFTAVMVLKAVEAQKLSLDQTIDKWYPEIQHANKITIKHLLSHRSGIHNFTDDKEFLSYNTHAKTEKEMLEIITKKGSDFKPNSKAEYSNSNFVLLSYILEKTYQKSYAALLQEMVAVPIGLTNTYVFGKIDVANKECRSYSFTGAWELETETDYTIPLGAGAIISTPTDLTIFADKLFEGKLLSPQSLELMKTLKDGFGLGLFSIPFYKSKGYGHTGGIDGFNAVYVHFEDSNLSYALTCNGSNYNTNDISIAVLSAFYGRTYEVPVFTSFAVSSEELDQYLGVYASKKIPLKITVTKKGNTLVAQGTGQSALPLEATAKDKFRFKDAGAEFEFNPSEKTLVLLQGGKKILFSKE